MKSVASKMDKGSRESDKKLRVDLVPPCVIEGLAEVLTFGAKKYGDHNWKKGLYLEKEVVGPLLRHLLAWRQGQELDPESGMHTLKHVLCNAAFLVYFANRKEQYYGRFDDRDIRHKPK